MGMEENEITKIIHRIKFINPKYAKHAKDLGYKGKHTIVRDRASTQSILSKRIGRIRNQITQ